MQIFRADWCRYSGQAGADIQGRLVQVFRADWCRYSGQAGAGIQGRQLVAGTQGRQLQVFRADWCDIQGRLVQINQTTRPQIQCQSGTHTCTIHPSHIQLNYLFDLGADPLTHGPAILNKALVKHKPHSQLPCLLEKKSELFHARTATGRCGRPKIAQLGYIAVGGISDEVAAEASKHKAKYDKQRKICESKQRGKTRAKRKLAGRGTGKGTSLQHAVEELDQAAQKIGAHVLYVPAIRSGKKAKSRLTDRAKVLTYLLRNTGGIAAKRVGECMKVVTEHLGEKPFTEQWSSTSTVLRTELIMDQIELILLREHIPNALDLSVCWDLSPQAGKELLVTQLRVVFAKADIPEIYDEAGCVAGENSTNICVFDFTLPVLQCANKDHDEVAKKIKEQLKLTGIEPRNLPFQGPIFVTSDGGSENRPAMALLFGEEGEDFIHVYCAAHAWNLAFTHACDTLPGRSKDPEKKNTKMTHWCVTKTYNYL